MVNVGPGRPITIPTGQEMTERGVTDGAADREAGLYELAQGSAVAVKVADVTTIVGTYGWYASQAAAMTVERHNEGIAQTNAKVASRSNDLALAAGTRDHADKELAAAAAAKDGFTQRVTELADPALALTIPAPASPTTALPAPEHAPGEGQTGDRAPAEHDTVFPGQAWRFPLRRDLHPLVVMLLLVMIAGAEFALNARAFQSVREVQWQVLLLAALVGVGIVTLAHRIGSCARDLLEVPVGAAGRSPAKLVEVALEVPALLAGIVGVASIRASYFSLVGIRIPTFGLVCIQLALAIAAVGTTMAGRSQAADESRDRARRVDQRQHNCRQPAKAHTAAQNRLVDAEANLRSALQSLVNDFNIQVPEVALAIDAYIRSYATAAGIKVTGSLPAPAKPELVAQAEQWLSAHPLGTRAHLDLPYNNTPATHETDHHDHGITPITHHHEDAA